MRKMIRFGRLLRKVSYCNAYAVAFALALLISVGIALAMIYMRPKVRITISSYDDWQIAIKSNSTSEDMNSKPDFELWSRYHQKVVKVAAKYGSVGQRNTSDFYYTGDWIHHLIDGLVIQNPKCLTLNVLAELQEVVAEQKLSARLTLVGDDDPIDGLKILITGADVLVAWYGLDAKECKERLKAIRILSR